MSWEKSLTSFGITLILIGIALILVPLLMKLIPSVDFQKIPWFLLYVYRKNGFVFVTSPILIVIGIGYFLYALVFR